MKDFLNNNISLAILCLTIISCWSMVVMGVGAKEIVIPIATGISGLATGVGIGRYSAIQSMGTKTEEEKPT